MLYWLTAPVATFCVIPELSTEALALAGWGFVLWCRLEAMRVG
jgi:hypothetical protein